MTGPLSHLRVVEIGDDIGAYAGKLLAELGAEVVRAVLVDGAPDGLSVDPDPAVQSFLHRSKWSIEVESGEQVAALVAGADVVLVSGPTGLLRSVGVDPDELRAARPELVVVELSAFGSDDPGPASDLVCSAAGGFLALGGWPDSAPTRAWGDQAWRMASLHGAVGAVLALLEREQSGLGQHVEVSAQEAVATALENALQYCDLEGVVRRRIGPGYDEAGTGVYSCADGHVYVMVGRLSTRRGWGALLDWLGESDPDGAAELRHPRWEDAEHRRTPEAQRRFREIFDRFAAARPKAELYVAAQRRGIAICPINTPDDLVHNDHLAARAFYVQDGAGLQVGAPYRLSGTPWAPGPHVREGAVHDAARS